MAKDSKREEWIPPKTETVSVISLIEAMEAAIGGDPEALRDIKEGIDREEWFDAHLVFRTPNQMLITPVKIGGNWNSLQLRYAE